MRSLAISAAAALAIGSLQPLPALAQAAGTQATKPATAQDINVYSQMGAINICVLSVNKVGLDKSLPASVEMFVSVVSGLHGAMIQGVNNGAKLERNQLANGGVAQIAPRVQALCADKLSAADKKTIDEILAQLQKAGRPQGQGR